MVTLHNLSADPATIPLQGDLADLAGANQVRQVRQVLGDPEPLHRPVQEITLGRYGFRWLQGGRETPL